MRVEIGVLLTVVIFAGCTPAKSPSEECRRQNAWKRVGRSSHPDPRLDALEDIRCDEMERDERREAREDRHREEDRREREQARREVLAAVAPRETPPATVADGSSRASAPWPDLTGLWIGNYGNDRLETVRIAQDGPYVLAVKVTGDENVPAGKPTFRVTLSGRRGIGAQHGAEEGYQNPRWFPGHLDVLSNDVIEFTADEIGTTRFKRVRD
jgi:predicted  nucleic acid-binding Zn-ribbon protein